MAYTRAQTRTLIRQRTHTEESDAIGDTEIDNHINDSALYVHDFLIQTLGASYAMSEGTLTTATGITTYALNSLTPGFYRPFAARLTFDGRSYPLGAFSPVDEALYTSGLSWGPGSLPRVHYNLAVNSIPSVVFNIAPDTAVDVTFQYHRTAPSYAIDSDLVEIPYPDLLLAQACHRVKQHEERDNPFVQECMLIQKRIEDWVGTMDKGNPKGTVRAKRRRGRYGYPTRIF